MYMIKWQPTPTSKEMNRDYLDVYCSCFHANAIETIRHFVATSVFLRYYQCLGPCIQAVMRLDVTEIADSKDFERLCRDLHKTEPRSSSKSSFLKVYRAKNKNRRPNRFLRVNHMCEHCDEVFDDHIFTPCFESCFFNIPNRLKEQAVTDPDSLKSFWSFCDIADMMFSISYPNDMPAYEQWWYEMAWYFVALADILPTTNTNEKTETRS